MDSADGSSVFAIQCVQADTHAFQDSRVFRRTILWRVPQARPDLAPDLGEATDS